jgi:hypothetical protein
MNELTCNQKQIIEILIKFSNKNEMKEFIRRQLKVKIEIKPFKQDNLKYEEFLNNKTYKKKENLVKYEKIVEQSIKIDENIFCSIIKSINKIFVLILYFIQKYFIQKLIMNLYKPKKINELHNILNM